MPSKKNVLSSGVERALQPKRLVTAPPIVEAPSDQVDPRDAWEKAADAMVERVLAESPSLREAALQPSVAIFIQVADEWLHPVAEAWARALFVDPPVPADGDSFEPTSRTCCDGSEETALWCEYRRHGIDKPSKSCGTNGIAWALSRGLPLYGFAPSLDALPRNFQRVYERRVVIPAPDGAILDRVVELICGKRPSTPIPDHVCPKITEVELLLAVRPNQTPDQYVDRVVALVEAKSNAATTAVDFTLDHIGGMSEAVQWGQGLARDVEDYRADRIEWSDVDPGALLVGPPGTGKTTFARALAGSTGLNLVIGSLAEWQAAGHLGDLLKAMRATFAKARASKPSLLFIDEIDSFGDRAKFNANDRDYCIQVVNGLLEELDGSKGREGVVVVAACNDASRLDPALLRAGRLDRVIQIGLPNAEEIERIMRYHLGTDLVGEDISEAARAAVGKSGADAVQWVRQARRDARSNRRPIVVADLVQAVGASARTISESAFHRVAIHEIGHAVVVAVTSPGNLLGVAIKRSGQSPGGHTLSRSERDTANLDVDRIQGDLTMLLAGRAAEELVLGKPSAGSGGSAGSDLALATLLATRAVVTFGLFDATLTWRGEVADEHRAELLLADPRIAAEVERLLGEAYKRALDLLRPRCAIISSLAAVLVEKEVLSGEYIENAINLEQNLRNALISRQGPAFEGEIS